MTRLRLNVNWLVALAGAGLALVVAAAAVASSNGPADGTIALGGVLALLGAAVVVATLEPALTISIGLALGVFSGQFSQLGSPSASTASCSWAGSS